MEEGSGREKKRGEKKGGKKIYLKKILKF